MKTLIALCLATAAWAAQARDPMEPPVAARPLLAAASAAAPAQAPVPPPRLLLVVDGKRYVVDGTRRRAEGELLGGARIERIEDGAVVVRSEGRLLRLPLFAGVDKRPAADESERRAPAPRR
jgi:hypothetical protein